MTDEEKEWALSQATPESTTANLAALLMIAGAAKFAPAAATAALKRSVLPMIRNEWRQRTLNRDTYQDKIQFGIEPKGIEGWSPWNAFRWGAGGGPQTGPTKGAESALQLMINTMNKDNKVEVK